MPDASSAATAATLPREVDLERVPVAGAVESGTGLPTLKYGAGVGVGSEDEPTPEGTGCADALERRVA